MYSISCRDHLIHVVVIIQSNGSYTNSLTVKLKGRVKLSLRLTERHAMNTHPVLN